MREFVELDAGLASTLWPAGDSVIWFSLRGPAATMVLSKRMSSVKGEPTEGEPP